MRGRMRNAGLFVMLIGLPLLVGCFGGAANPSYFPYYLPPGDVIQTHAKPPGFGYFADFDRNAASVETAPTRCTNPVGSDQVVIATVFDEDGVPRRKRRIEWILEGPGELLEVDESGYTAGRGYLVGNQRGVSYTSLRRHVFDRGNDNERDDFTIEPGQTWCIVRSLKPGETIVTAYAPAVHNHDRRTAVTRLTWTDGPTPDRIPEPRFAPTRTSEARLPEIKPIPITKVPVAAAPGDKLTIAVPANVTFDREATVVLTLANRTGETQESVILETTLPADVEFFSSDVPPTVQNEHQLLWTVGPLASGASEVRRIAVRPMRKGETNFSATARFADNTTAVARATTTVGTGVLQVNLEVPDVAAPEQPIAVGVFARNPGGTPATNVVAWLTVPAGLRHTSGKNPVEVTMGTLAPGEDRRVEIPLTAATPGRFLLRANSVADGGLTSQTEVGLEVRAMSLKLTLEGASQVVLNEPASRSLTVTNSGDAPTEQIRIRVNLPLNWSGRSETGDSLTWSIPTIPAKGTQTLRFTTIAGGSGGSGKLQAVADTAGGTVSAESTLKVVGQSVLQLDSLELPRSGIVGRDSVIRIVVRNVGNGSARTIDIVLTASGAAAPAAGTGPDGKAATLAGNTLTFPILNELPPGKSAVLEATITGRSAGDARLRVAVQATGLSKPLVEEQMLRIAAGS